MENRILETSHYSSLQETFEYINMFHLNKGRGFGIYCASDLCLLRSNAEYDNFLNKHFGHRKDFLGESLIELSSAIGEKKHLAFFNKVNQSLAPVCINNLTLSGCNNIDMIFDITLIPIFDKKKTLVYIIESFSDITKSEKQQEFFSYICHEFKTPLTVILSAVQAIKVLCKDELSPRSLKYIRKIHQGSLQQWRLVTHLLDIIKSETSYLKSYKKNLDIVKMTESITEAVSIYANTKDIKIDFYSSVKELIIGIDDEKYERVLLNLLSNAIKYTPRGNAIFVKIDKEKERIKISVKDTGIGILEKDIPSIFDLFSQVENSLTRKTEGTGIGLHLVKELVTTMEGEITVQSRPNIGSIFTLLLPAETVLEEEDILSKHNLEDTRLIDVTNIEFSNIYFD